MYIPSKLLPCRRCLSSGSMFGSCFLNISGYRLGIAGESAGWIFILWKVLFCQAGLFVTVLFMSESQKFLFVFGDSRPSNPLCNVFRVGDVLIFEKVWFSIFACSMRSLILTGSAVKFDKVLTFEIQVSLNWLLVLLASWPISSCVSFRSLGDSIFERSFLIQMLDPL